MSKKPFGALILHGFSDTVNSISILEPPLNDLGLPYRIPSLRGHGADSPEALHGVSWQDWVDDANEALHDLLNEVDKVIVIGYSMGGLIGINLAANNPDFLDSLILVAAVIQIEAPIAPGRLLSFMAPLIIKLIKKWSMPPEYIEPELAKNHDSYPWVPTDAIASLFELSKLTRKRLDEVSVPTLIIQSRKDTTAAPECPEIIFNSIATLKDSKKIIWFEKTGHEMFRDCERDEVVKEVVSFVKERID